MIKCLWCHVAESNGLVETVSTQSCRWNERSVSRSVDRIDEMTLNLFPPWAVHVNNWTEKRQTAASEVRLTRWAT